MTDALDITRFASCGGCAAKVAPLDLRALLHELPRGASVDPRVLVGAETSDDAGVVMLSDRDAVVTTADFITPLVNDPALYGAIAAANAIGDVYAMGGEPLCAIALCVLPKELPADVASAILDGGRRKAAEAGIAIVGGHTVRGPELLYGLAVTGRIDPQKIWRNSTAKVGDALILTKPVGAGLVVNGMRKGVLSLEAARPSLAVLATLHRDVTATIGRGHFTVHAATDITGFGLAGHALEMAHGAGVTVAIELGALPLYEPVAAMIGAGVTTGSTIPNRNNAAPHTKWVGERTAFWDEVVHDPQTSGGLLLSVPAAEADALIAALRGAGVVHARRVGRVILREGLDGAPLQLHV